MYIWMAISVLLIALLIVLILFYLKIENSTLQDCGEGELTGYLKGLLVHTVVAYDQSLSSSWGFPKCANSPYLK